MRDALNRAIAVGRSRSRKSVLRKLQTWEETKYIEFKLAAICRRCMPWRNERLTAGVVGSAGQALSHGYIYIYRAWMTVRAWINALGMSVCRSYVSRFRGNLGDIARRMGSASCNRKHYRIMMDDRRAGYYVAAGRCWYQSETKNKKPRCGQWPKNVGRARRSIKAILRL